MAFLVAVFVFILCGVCVHITKDLKFDFYFTLFMNSLFPLSENFISFLSSDKIVTPYYLKFPSANNSKLSNLALFGSAELGVSNFVLAVLRSSLSPEVIYTPQDYVFLWIFSVNEVIKNAYDHGQGLENGFHLGLFLGDNALGFGINDGGDFFKREEVVLYLKNKQEPPKDKYPSLYKLGVPGSRVGFSKVYQWADFVDVDTSVGTLYLKKKKNTILTKR